jgi:hypothetical protein
MEGRDIDSIYHIGTSAEEVSTIGNAITQVELVLERKQKGEGVFVVGKKWHYRVVIFTG